MWFTRNQTIKHELVMERGLDGNEEKSTHHLSSQDKSDPARFPLTWFQDHYAKLGKLKGTEEWDSPIPLGRKAKAGLYKDHEMVQG